MKVYPLDIDEGLFPEVPDLAFEQEMLDTYPELFENMDVDDFLSCDFAMVNRDEPVDATSGLPRDDLEEGEIPTL
nr:unknown [Zea mays]